MGEPTDNHDKTRPSQLMPTGDNAIKALEGFLLVMGFHAEPVNGQFSAADKAAYDQARTQYSFLPELGDTPDESAMLAVFQAIDRGLQDNVTFQQHYIEGVKSQTNASALQGALVAGGSWANRHLGDHISNAEPIAIDGDRGTLTNRGVRNAATLTGVATMQSSLNLLTGSSLTPSGIIDAGTLTTMRSYAQAKGLEWSDNTQEDFARITQYIQANEGDALRTKIAEALNTDSDHSAPDAHTLDAQIVMNGLARQAESDIRTAPDSRQTDSHITDEKSHTRTVIAPETGVELTPHQPTTGPEETIAAEHHEHTPAPPPFGLNAMYRVTRHDVLEQIQPVIDRQNASETAPQNILAYSEKANGFLLITKTETEGQSAVYQISDRNVSQILSGITDGSIALDESASKHIAEIVHGESAETTAYTVAELRTAFAGDATRFTGNTRERLLTTSATLTNGDGLIFGLDDMHDALNKLDSKRDWAGQEDPIAIRDYIRDLRNATRDAREERTFTVPQWQGGALDASNSVEVNIGGQSTRIPSQIWDRISTTLSETQRGFSTGRNASTLERRNSEGALISAAQTPDSGTLAGNFGAAGDVAEDLIASNASDIGAEGEIRTGEISPEIRQPETAPVSNA
ncbi:MAG: hypothetical protein H6858_05740 [Rhodospirillales bacterium]|nr:hypothetical protein [Alphaproteobacteria bacterium]MCB1840651.1 hypothetical protein [Alphaproteobacteria bacterium]MCB9977078.1 hypothetical protein [Rhodospirillales bacterium]